MKYVPPTVVFLVLVGANVAQAQPTFNKDVAPMLFQQCATCHRPGESAPFSLLS